MVNLTRLSTNMKIGILGIGFGNTRSVKQAVNYFNIDPIIIKCPSQINKVDKLILPGVGAYPNAMAILKKSGMFEEINLFKQAEKPIFGICLGMQLFYEKSYELGESLGFNWLEGVVRPLRGACPEDVKVPHIGWSRLSYSSVERGGWKVRSCEVAYFVHSYFVAANDSNKADALTCNFYDVELIAATRHDNLFATQFHPEKSGKQGLSFYEEFIGE